MQNKMIETQGAKIRQKPKTNLLKIESPYPLFSLSPPPRIKDYRDDTIAVSRRHVLLVLLEDPPAGNRPTCRLTAFDRATMEARLVVDYKYYDPEVRHVLRGNDQARGERRAERWRWSACVCGCHFISLAGFIISKMNLSFCQILSNSGCPALEARAKIKINAKIFPHRPDTHCTQTSLSLSLSQHVSRFALPPAPPTPGPGVCRPADEGQAGAGGQGGQDPQRVRRHQPGASGRSRQGGLSKVSRAPTMGYF